MNPKTRHAIMAKLEEHGLTLYSDWTLIRLAFSEVVLKEYCLKQIKIARGES